MNRSRSSAPAAILLVIFLVVNASPITNSLSKSNSSAKLGESTPRQTQIPRGWKKFAVGLVTFFLPPKLEKVGLPGNSDVIEAFCGETVSYVNYAYGEHVPSSLNPWSGKIVESSIGSHRAFINIWEYDKLEQRVNNKLVDGQILYVPDVGDGKHGFEIYIVCEDSKLIEQIFATVEIH